MAKGNRKVPEINSSSTADIAFLLLIFFLITTSMDTDRGLARQLPPPPDKDQVDNDIVVKDRNVLQIFLNFQNQLMCGGEVVDVKQLREKPKNSLPIHITMKITGKHAKDVPFFGNTMVTENHVISLQSDRGSSYQAYFDVQNELVAAYNELRDELAQEKWQKNYAELNEDQQKAIREIFPQKISEAEPKGVKKNN